MDLGSSTLTARGQDGRSTGELLDDVSDFLGVQRNAELGLFRTIVAWADAHTIDTLEGAATIRESLIDTGLPLAGDGAPLVSEFALMELCATLERSLDSGREYVGKIVECAWRLPKITQLVEGKRVPIWKALQVADLTRSLSADAAGFVDRNLSLILPTCTWTQIHRCVNEAIDRHDPIAAEEKRRKAADSRGVFLDEGLLENATGGTGTLTAVLDLADLKDVDTALSRRAKLMGELGCEETLQVRRSLAMGEMARADLLLDLEVVDPDTGEITRVVTGRRVELFVHLTDAAISGVSAGSTHECVGRVGHQPVSVEQIRQWCGAEDTTILVRPIVDLADHVPVDSYEIPDRLKARVDLRDHTCRAPHCQRPAERCDHDHAEPHATGGATCPCNLVPLCRRHHRAKTAAAWSYVIVEPGTYLWTGPTGQQWLVDHRGTTNLGRPRPLIPDADPSPSADPGWTEDTHGNP